MTKAERTQLDRSRALLADDRADNLVPSIRSAEISRPGGETDDDVIRPPTAQAGDWRDPHDLSPNASHRPRRIYNLRRANNLEWLRSRGAALDQDHVTAGAIYERDFELSQRGHFPGCPPPEVRGAPGPGDYSRLIDGGQRFRRAEAAIGPLGADLMRHVVLGAGGAPPTTLTAWAATRQFDGKRLSRLAASGVLVATLDLLVGHYGRRRLEQFRAAAD